MEMPPKTVNKSIRYVQRTVFPLMFSNIIAVPDVISLTPQRMDLNVAFMGRVKSNRDIILKQIT